MSPTTKLSEQSESECLPFKVEHFGALFPQKLFQMQNDNIVTIKFEYKFTKGLLRLML